MRFSVFLSQDTSQPASLFSCDGFLDWTIQNKVVNSRDQFPSPSCISGSALNDVYLAVHNKLKQKLLEAPSVIVIMLDMWIDAYAKVPYINISIQYFSIDFQLKVYQICTKRFDHPHTAKNLAEILTTTLAEFELDNLVSR